MEKYKVINLIKRKTIKFEGVVIEDENGTKFITNGVFKWEATHKRMKECDIVDSIDKEKFLKFWNKYFPYCKLEF